MAEKQILTAHYLNRISKETTNLSQSVNKLIEATRELVRDRSTPLSLLRAFYLQNMQYSLKDARREIRRIILKPYFYGMDGLLDDSKQAERENYLK